MIPSSLQHWTLDVLYAILDSQAYESDLVEWKEVLPDSRDKEAKERLSQACAAMANSSGGFLVFGVRDDRRLAAQDRVVGLDPTIDFLEHFGNFPAKCLPPVSWVPRNPPLLLPTGNVVCIIQIPESWRGPHAFSNRHSLMVFDKRTSKGNERMTYRELETAFAGKHRRTRVLRALTSELKLLEHLAGLYSQKPAIRSGLSLDIGVLEGLLPDAIGFLDDDQISDLSSIRLICRYASSEGSRLRQEWGAAITLERFTLAETFSETFREHAEAVGVQLMPLLQETKTAIEVLLNDGSA